MPVESALVAIFLALVHFVARRLDFPAGSSRSFWLSGAGGASVAYVFLHLLPELHEGQLSLEEHEGPWQWLRLEGSGIYLMALAGLTVFYGLERLAARSRSAERSSGRADRTGGSAFMLHVGSFALYNFVVGYLLLAAERDNIFLYGLALGLHFIVNDESLRQHHKERYDALGRWVLAGAVLLGWAVALGTDIPELAIRVLTAFLAGGVILNVLKEELPEERASRFRAFAAGVIAYGALLLVL